MSWSVNATGVKEKVAEACAVQFNGAAANYTGQEEEQDILAAKARCLAAIEGLKLDDYANGVSVRCNGSRSTYSVSVNVSVERVKLEI